MADWPFRPSATTFAVAMRSQSSNARLRSRAHRFLNTRAVVATALLLGVAAIPRAALAVDKDVHIVVGIGYSSVLQKDATGKGQGGFGQGELVFKLSSWFTPRAYAGLILTWPDGQSCGADVTTPDAPCDVSSKLGFVGAKARMMAPIPYVAPFIEIGLGGAVGSQSTRNGTAFSKHATGVMFHVPLTLGLALGEAHQYEIALSYLYYPSQKHLDGALGIGIGFPLP